MTAAATRPWLGHASPLATVRVTQHAAADGNVVGLVNVPSDGLYQRSHFPGFAVFPGVFVAELCGRLALELVDQTPVPWAVTKICALRLVAPVYPGDRLEISAQRNLSELIAPGCRAVSVRSRVTRAGRVVATARLTIEPQR
ncbi:hypothetical protein AB0H36_33925 [Kribbella sp. NPDC050820]|uniref:hypothetical protein n=1 Tax=Kribbella sp. NPDC050820 TaxID=3155408 RepID=UPI00340C3278